jgi:uncharacterized membrane protein
MNTTNSSPRAARRSAGIVTFVTWIVHLPVRIWRVAEAHGLNPWVFITLSALGYGIHAMVYLPWFQSHEWQLAFLIVLRVLALIIPAYILLKGKRIAHALSSTVVVMFTVNTAWHVCYYVYL